MSQATTQPQTRPTTSTGPAVTRQFVNFACYKLDPAFRRLGKSEKDDAKAELVDAINTRIDGLISLTYSTAGLRAETDFMIWRIAESPDTVLQQTYAINRTMLAGYLTTPHSFVAMTKRSMYIDKVDPFHTAESRTHIVPGKRKFLFV